VRFNRLHDTLSTFIEPFTPHTIYHSRLASHELATACRPQKRCLTPAVDGDSSKHIFAVGGGKDLQYTSPGNRLVAGGGKAALLLDELAALIVLGETVAFDVRYGAGVVGIDVDGDIGVPGSGGNRRGGGD